MRTGSDQLSARRTAAAFFTILASTLAWTPWFLPSGHSSSRLAAQEEPLNEEEEKTEEPSGGETLEKKRPEKLLVKKVLETKSAGDEQGGKVEEEEASGLSADDLFGVGELAPEEEVVEEVEEVEDLEAAPTVLELLEAKDPRDLDLWEKFLLHLKAEGHDEVIDEMGLNDVDNPVDFTRGDPIRGVLFRISGELLRLDTMFQEASGSPLEGSRRERALAAAGSLRASDDPFLKVYGDYYQARLELEAAIEPGAGPDEEEKRSEPEKPEDAGGSDPVDPESATAPDAVLARPRIKDEAALDRAMKLLLGLTASEYFLPQDEARRYLADIYLARDDATLAILEWQLYLTELPRARQAERTMAEERIRQIRESTQHPGPLRESVDRMRLVSGRLDKGDVGAPTQTEAVRLEDVLEKVAKLLEKAEQAGSQSMSMQGQASMRSQLTQGQRQRKRQSQQLQQLARNGQQNQQNQQNQNQQNQQQNNRQNREKQEHAGSQEGKTALKDVGEKDREVWGKTNLRDVATSLKGVWDKIPVTYRQLVTQYFQDISDLEPEERTE